MSNKVREKNCYHMSMKKRWEAVRFHALAIAVGFIMVYPLLWLLSSSFKSNDTIFKDSYSLIPKVWDVVTNYTTGWQGISGVSFGTFMMNSLVVTIAGSVCGVFSALLAAYAFSRIDFKLSKLWFSCVIVTLMIPSQVMVVPQYIILKKIGLIDTKLALILPWAFGSAFFIFLMNQFFRGIPKELDEAAKIDGCGEIGILFKILFPVVRPTVVTCFIFSFYWIWQDFFQPLIFMNSVDKFTVSLALNMFLDPNSYNNYGGLFAMSFVSLVPIVVFFIIFQKYIVDGIAMDGIKG